MYPDYNKSNRCKLSFYMKILKTDLYLYSLVLKELDSFRSDEIAPQNVKSVAK